jgi:hypothetical protein
MPGSQACQDVLKNLSNPYYLSKQPALTGTTGWGRCVDVDPERLRYGRQNDA